VEEPAPFTSLHDALEEAGVPLDFRVKVTFKNKAPKICSLTWASWDIGCDKWELTYYLAKDGSCFFGKNSETKAEIVE
jgi:hypothetical protein